MDVRMLVLHLLWLIVALHLVKHLDSLKLHHLALAMQGQLGHVLRDALPANFKLRFCLSLLRGAKFLYTRGNSGVPCKSQMTSRTSLVRIARLAISLNERHRPKRD
jgi:hypothetical protein